MMFQSPANLLMISSASCLLSGVAADTVSFARSFLSILGRSHKYAQKQIIHNITQIGPPIMHTDAQLIVQELPALPGSSMNCFLKII